MRRFIFVIMLILLALSLIACGADNSSTTTVNAGNAETSTNAGNANGVKDWSSVSWEEENFRVSSHLSATHKLYTNFYEPLYKHIEEVTNGKVSFEIFWSGELVDLGEETNALKDGLIDMAWPISPTYEGDKMPMAEVTLLPLTKSDCSIATEAWKLLLESDVILQDGMTFRQMTFDKYDLKVFAPTISETYTIGTVNKEFNSIDKIKSMKLRTSSRSQQLYTEALGCSAITMPAADLFDALSRGALDGAFLWIPDWPNFGLQNLFTNACEGLNIGHFPSVLAMTQERWDDLQPELKQLIIESVEKYRVSGAKGVVDAYEKVKKEAENVEFIHLSELPNDVQTYLIDAMEQTWYDYINLLETEGLPGTEVCRLWRDCIKEAGGEVPEGINNL